jgi:hypothetical protein
LPKRAEYDKRETKTPSRVVNRRELELARIQRNSIMPSFVATLRKEVSVLVKKLKISSHRAFNIWFAKVVLDLNEEEALEATGVEGANDKNIDLFWIDDDSQKVVVVQGKYGADGAGGVYRPKIKEVDSLIGCLNWLASPESLRQDGKDDLAESAEEYVKAIREGYGVELWFVYAGPKCKNVEKQIAVYNANPENADPPKSCVHCHIGLLEANFDETTGRAKRLESETIGLVDGKHFEYEADFGEALVGTVPATELVRIYQKYEDKLFDRNVRLFLGAKKGSINAGIAETIRTLDKSNFWAYNNGLTLVCSKFTATSNSVQVHDFCIVNGCQSTRSLVDNQGNLDESVTVLVRVLAVSHDLVDKVIMFTNSQNPIRAWDIASQHKTQRRLKKEFAELSKPILYITRRGDPLPGPLGNYKNGGKPRQIKLREVGQYVAAFAGQPVLAYKNKAFIFSNRHDDIFPHDIKVEEVLFAWICGQESLQVVSEFRKRASNEDDKRILIKGGVLFTIAVLGHVARLRNGATYVKALAEEQITSKAGRERVRKYAKYAVEAYLRCVKDAQEIQGGELPTLIRSPQFFDKVRDRVESKYRTESLSRDWLNDVLPKLV